MGTIKRSLKLLSIILVTCWLLGCAFLYARQESIIFHPKLTVEQTPDTVGLAFEPAQLKTEDGELIQTWFVPSPTTDSEANRFSTYVVLFCHGNAGNLGSRVETLSLLHDIGVNVMAFDYRGYGKSTGSPTEQGLYTDAQTVWRHLLDRGYPPEHIIVMGRSLGGGVASWLAHEFETAALIMESTFTSIPDVAAKQYPIVPVHTLVKHPFASAERIALIEEPILIAHSREDSLIEYSHGEKLFALAQSPKSFLELKGNHNNTASATGPAYSEGLVDFLDSFVLGTAP